MDYQTIDRIINKHGFASEPAFKDLTVSLNHIYQPEPKKYCILGLYYPEYGMNVIPPDAAEATVLHELGHRYCHYYYDDLSEESAESFRKTFQRNGAMLYHGNDFYKLPYMGVLFVPGETGAVEFDCRRVNNNLVAALYNELASQAQGNQVPKLYYMNYGVRIEFSKSVDWFPIFAQSRALEAMEPLRYAVIKTGSYSIPNNTEPVALSLPSLPNPFTAKVSVPVWALLLGGVAVAGSLYLAFKPR